MIAIYKRELRSYFNSMIGYLFVAFLAAFTGIYFMVYNMNYGYPYFSYVLSSIVFVFLVAVPILTMRCFAEEKKNKTDQLLFTAPVSVMQIVLGKYLAMVTVLLIPNVISFIYPIIIKSQGKGYFKVDYTSILAFFLLGCVYISIGMFISALTESQIIAAVGTFAILLAIFLWSGIISFLPTSAISGVVGLILILTAVALLIYSVTKNWVMSAGLEGVGIIAIVVVYFVKSSLLENVLTNLFGVFALSDVLDNFASNNLFDLQGLFLYVSLIFVFVFLTIQSLQKRRWS